jgi:signal transduction histidine kinase
MRHLILAWLALTVAGGVVGIHLALVRLSAAFEAEAETAYRALAQGLREHEVLLETLALLQPPAPTAGPVSAEQRLSGLYPAVLRLLRQDPRSPWPAEWAPVLEAGEGRSRQTARSVLVPFDLAAGRYWLVRSAEPASFALQVDLRQLAAQSVQGALAGRAGAAVWLEHEGVRHVVAPGATAVDEGARRAFAFRRRLAMDGLPVDFVAQRQVDALALPWTGLAAWFLATSVVALGVAGWWIGTAARGARREAAADAADRRLRRADPRDLRSAAAAGGALAVVVPQPARAPLRVTLRELDAEPPELLVARGAIRQAARRSQRAAQAIERLRRGAESPGVDAPLQRVDWLEILGDALELVEPECARLGVVPLRLVDDAVREVRADPAALEQIVHHLLSRALQALRDVPQPQRHLELSVSAPDDTLAELSVRHTGAGLSPAEAAQLASPPSTGDVPWQPIARCAALAAGMGGRLQGGAEAPAETVLRLTLPRAAT